MNLLNEVTIQQAKELILGVYEEHMSDNTTAPNIMLRGSMGMGKSSIIAQVGEQLGMGLIDIRLSSIMESDLMGIPYVHEGEMRFSTPQWWPTDGKPYILLLDEIGNAPVAVQHAAYRLILDRSITNGKVLPPNVYIMAATNLKSDKTGARELVPAANNRFGIHLFIDSKRAAESFLNHAVESGFHRDVVGFLSWKKEWVFQAPKDEPSFPTPRSWEGVSKHCSSKFISSNNITLQTSVAGAVGSAAAVDFMAFLEYNQHLPDWERLRNDQSYVYNIPKNDDALQYALSVALAFEVIEAIKAEDVAYIDTLSELLHELAEEIKIVTFRTMKRHREVFFNLVKYQSLRDEFHSVSKYIK